MTRIIVLLHMMLAALPMTLYGQDRYEAIVTDFSTAVYDEFSPVIHKGDLVFCSNQEAGLLFSYRTGTEKSLFNVFKVGILDTLQYSNPRIFHSSLTTPYNDGPLAFSPDSTQLVISRNLDVKPRRKNFSAPGNELGLFFAESAEAGWGPVQGFEYNGPDYSITTPCYSSDGKYLYYASDMPGGLGGADLYRSEKLDSTWGSPENLGQVINTPGNEVFPFLAADGMLFFSSDGHPGMGGKDLFLTINGDSGWSAPVHLVAPINSNADDFSIYTSDEFYEGYISSNRLGSDDIFMFRTLIPQLYNCEQLLTNRFCYEFWDEEANVIDSIPVTYEWEFSDGSRMEGLRVEKCFEGGGSYWARLNIVDRSTDSTFQTQAIREFVLEDYIQPYITVNDSIPLNQAISFSGINSNLPGFEIDEYIWDFGDGGFEKGMEVEHTYKRIGQFSVKLGVFGHQPDGEQRELKCVVKQIWVRDVENIP